MATLTAVPNVLDITHVVEEEEKNLWADIMSEVGPKTSQSPQGAVVITGDDGAGKTSLLRQYCKLDTTHCFSSALEYNLMNIQSTLKDSSYAYQLGSANAAIGNAESINLPIYTLSGYDCFEPLLKFALPPKLSQVCFLVTVSLNPPDKVIPCLEKWIDVIRHQIRESYSPEEVTECQQAQVRYWQEYVEPLDTSTQHDSEAVHLDVTLPLEDIILQDNVGAPIVIVVTKSDTYSQADEPNLNRLQFHVRKFAMRIGAAVVYVSSKNKKNIQLLNKYITHRVYGFPFTSGAIIVDPDSVFVPAGWDSSKKLEIIREILPDEELPQGTADDSGRFSTSNQNPIDGEYDDDETWLLRLHDKIIAGANGSKNDQLKINQMPNATVSNSPILSFFGGLMKNTPKQAGAGVSVSGADAEAHFQKILSNTKPRKSSTLTGDRSPRLTENLSANNLADISTEFDGGMSDNSMNNDSDSQPPSARSDTESSAQPSQPVSARSENEPQLNGE